MYLLAAHVDSSFEYENVYFFVIFVRNRIHDRKQRLQYSLLRK